MFKAVIFDRDGVLVDSEGFHLRTVELGLQRQGIVLTSEEKADVAGRYPTDYFPEFRKKYSFDVEEAILFQSEYFDKHFSTVPVFNEVFALIRELKKDYLIGLTTSSDKEGTLELLERTNATELFDAVATGEDYPRRKPYPDPYLHTAKMLGVLPEECLVIEDSPVGVRSVKAAGMTCLAFPREFMKDQDFSLADKTITSVEEITEYLLHHN